MINFLTKLMSEMEARFKADLDRLETTLAMLDAVYRDAFETLRRINSDVISEGTQQTEVQKPKERLLLEVCLVSDPTKKEVYQLDDD